jgi:hypothetical protein
MLHAYSVDEEFASFVGYLKAIDQLQYLIIVK